jgi:hypothetical protein
MKKHALIYIWLVLLVAAGCKRYIDVNEDIRTPQQTTGEVLLPHMQSYMGFALGLDGLRTGKYIQYWGSNGPNDGAEAHNATATELWVMNYVKLGLPLNQMLTDAIKYEKWHYAGVAKALRAWSLQISTDHFGEIIMKQAWEPERYIFDFDSQSVVYAEVERLCMEALEYFNRETNKSITVASDNIYKGSKEKWVKFVYGLLAINANHLSNKSTYNPLKVIEYVDKAFAGNEDNARVRYAGTNAGTSATTSDASVYGVKRQNLTSLSYVQSTTILNMLTGYFRNVAVTDPRIVTLGKSPDGNYYGAIPGTGDPNSAASNVKRIPAVIGGYGTGTPAWTGRYLFKDTASFPIMTYSQLQFIKAEAAFKMGDKPKAFTAYKNGIEKSIDFVSTQGDSVISAAKKTAYMTSAAVAQTDADLTLMDIMCQKYIALWGYGFEETWADMRRYNYDTTIYKGYTIPDPTKLSNSNNGLLAQRFRPHTTDYSYNVESLKAIGADQPDYHVKPIWFAQP